MARAMTIKRTAKMQLSRKVPYPLIHVGQGDSYSSKVSCCCRRHARAELQHHKCIGYDILHAQGDVSDEAGNYAGPLIEVNLEHWKALFDDGGHPQLHPTLDEAADVMDKATVRIEQCQEVELDQGEGYLLEMEILGVDVAN
ncbi:hypothetical protein LTR56_024419 [Elasticomyces elasticus]|nr:hypothetical protein LTR56_024419 [Elasticomyces elasticus]KAK4903839.1 hypothetical protein LTR49_026604 [Elasticomyces elasticus]